MMEHSEKTVFRALLIVQRPHAVRPPSHNSPPPPLQFVFFPFFSFSLVFNSVLQKHAAMGSVTRQRVAQLALKIAVVNAVRSHLPNEENSSKTISK